MKVSRIPSHIIVNADDFGLRKSVNEAILRCFELNYINSTSLMVNKEGFEEAVEMIHKYSIIKNVGLHVNLVDGQPVTHFKAANYLTSDGEWDQAKTGKKINFFDNSTKKSFFDEIEGQLKAALEKGVKITHIDSHHHFHTLPAYYPFFLAIAKKYKMKLRMAQNYPEGNYFKYFFG